MSRIEANVIAFSTSGFSIPELIVRADTPEEMAGLLHGLMAVGITPTQPDPSEVNGEKTETIVTVVKRLHVGRNNVETPVIDMYPAWQGDYGQFRFAGLYLNTTEQIAEFEQRAGVRVADMPTYESQAPLQRNATRPHRCEITCTAFVARKAPDGEKEIDGKMQVIWKFAGYGDTPAAQQQASGQNGHSSEPELQKLTGVKTVKVVHKDDKKWLDAGGVIFWSRQAFRDAGYDTDTWDKPGTISLKELPFTVFYKQNGEFKEGKTVVAE